MKVHMELPQVWVDVLRAVQDQFPGAKIAGGCLRDLDHDRPVKDVDIFIPINAEYLQQVWHTESPQDLQKMLELAVAGPTNMIAASLYSASNDDLEQRNVLAVFQYERSGVIFEFIVGTPDSCNIEGFDLSLCQIEFDGTDVRRTDAYVNSTITKQVTIMTVNRKDRQRARMERILTKYPDYTDGGEIVKPV